MREFERVRISRRLLRRVKGERAHCAGAHVGEAVNRADRRRRNTLPREGGIDERVAKAIWNRIGEQRGKSVEGLIGWAREAPCSGRLVARHEERRNIEAP